MIGGEDGGDGDDDDWWWDDRVMMGMTMVCTATSIQKHTLILRKDLGSRTSAHALLVGATILIPIPVSYTHLTLPTMPDV